jgi:hypothetical protein
MPARRRLGLSFGNVPLFQGESAASARNPANCPASAAIAGLMIFITARRA